MAKKYENVEKILSLLGEGQLSDLQKRIFATEKNLSEIVKKITVLEAEKAEREAIAKAESEAREAEALAKRMAEEAELQKVSQPQVETEVEKDAIKNIEVFKKPTSVAKKTYPKYPTTTQLSK